jgi:hypothetical protein
MRPVRGIILHQAERAGCSRPGFHRHIGTQLDDSRMRLADGEMQEALWVKNRMLLGKKNLFDDFDSQFRRPRAMRMSAHSIDCYKQCGVIGPNYLDAILVLIAIPKETYFCCFNDHAVPGITGINEWIRTLQYAGSGGRV